MCVKLRSLFLSCILSLTLFGAACTPKEGETKGDVLLRNAKTTGRILAVAATEGLDLIAQHEAVGDPVDPDIKRGLTDAKKAIDAFNARAANYKKFDTESRADIIQFATSTVEFIEEMNNEGILRIKNPRSQAIARGIISGAKVAARLLKAQADEAPPAPA